MTIKTGVLIPRSASESPMGKDIFLGPSWVSIESEYLGIKVQHQILKKFCRQFICKSKIESHYSHSCYCLPKKRHEKEELEEEKEDNLLATTLKDWYQHVYFITVSEYRQLSIIFLHVLFRKNMAFRNYNNI